MGNASGKGHFNLNTKKSKHKSREDAPIDEDTAIYNSEPVQSSFSPPPHTDNPEDVSDSPPGTPTIHVEEADTPAMQDVVADTPTIHVEEVDTPTERCQSEEPEEIGSSLEGDEAPVSLPEDDE